MITVGSSTVGAILGLSPYQTPMKAWGKLIGLANDASSASAATERGNIIEPALLAWWERRNGRELTRHPPYGESPPLAVRDWMHARWDGLIPGELIVEIKTTRYFDDAWGADGSDIIPPSYRAQLVWQMAILEVPRCELVAFSTSTDEIRTYVVERDLVIETATIQAVESWMREHVWCDGWNPPGELPMELVHARYAEGGKDKAEMVAATPDDEWHARAYLEAQRMEADAMAKKEMHKRALCERIGAAYGIESLATWAPAKTPARLDVDKLKREFPQAYEACLVAGGMTRRFAVRLKDG
jgi:putative phage-type endonuclease